MTKITPLEHLRRCLVEGVSMPRVQFKPGKKARKPTVEEAWAAHIVALSAAWDQKRNAEDKALNLAGMLVEANAAIRYFRAKLKPDQRAMPDTRALVRYMSLAELASPYISDDLRALAKKERIGRWGRKRTTKAWRQLVEGRQ